MSHLLEVIARAERALASLQRLNVSRTGKMGVSREGHGSLVSLTPGDLRALVDAAAITAAAAQVVES